jgi:hypothetical protein
MAGNTGSAREEAERLVAAVLARASEQDLSRTRQRVTEGLGALTGSLAGLVGQFTGEAPPSGGNPTAGKPATEPPAADRPAPDPKASDRPAADRKATGAAHGFAGWSTGSAECCVCPVCKAIAAARNPSPATALRLATGAGDVATGAAQVMRGLSRLTGTTGKPPARKPAGKPARPTFDPDVTWSAATRAATPAETPAQPADRATLDPWSAATRTPAPKPAPEPAATTAPPAAHPASEPQEAANESREAASKPPAAVNESPAAASKPQEAASRPRQPAKQPWPAATPDETTRRRDPWAAATASLPPIAHVAPDGEGVQYGTASGGPETRTKKEVEDLGPGSSGESAVDHDVPGPVTAGPGSARAASAADGRGGEPGDDARAGDAG